MKWFKINKIFQEEIFDCEATVKGWVRSVRNSKAFSFIVLNDGSCFETFQIIADQSLENYEDIKSIKTGYCVSISGKLVKGMGKVPTIEMQASKVEIIGSVGDDYPLQKKGSTLEFLRDIAHLRARTNTFNAVFKLRHILSMATHEFFHNEGFYYLHSPIISGFDGEGAGDMFHVTTFDLNNPPKDDKGDIDYSKDYFGKETNLCVTGQLEGEACALALGSVYTFGPTFRAENSNTSRHLSEFWMIEPEVAFADLDDIADLATRYIKFLINSALTKCESEMKFFDKFYQKGLVEQLTKVRDSNFEKITYTEAIEILENSKEKFEYPVKWGEDLQTEHERYLTEKHFSTPVIVTDYPKDFKAFYMRMNDDQKTVRAMDILVPGVGEIIGGSQREERLEILQERMAAHQLEESDYWWYKDLRRHGGCPHSGFGLGFDRAVAYISGMSNIRDVIPFPRTPKNCEF